MKNTRRSKLTPDECEQIIASYLAGRPYDYITSRFSINRMTIYKVLKRHNVDCRYVNSKTSGWRREAMIMDYKAGIKATAIAAEFGVPSSAVSRVANLAGYRRTPPGKRGRPRTA